MRIRADDDTAAALLRDAEIAVAEVEAVGVGVVLDGDAELGGATKDGRQIEIVGFASQELAAGGMAEDADLGVRDGAEDAGGHLLARLAEERVHAGDDDVHLGED